MSASLFGIGENYYIRNYSGTWYKGKKTISDTPYGENLWIYVKNYSHSFLFECRVSKSMYETHGNYYIKVRPLVELPKDISREIRYDNKSGLITLKVCDNCDGSRNTYTLVRRKEDYYTIWISAELDCLKKKVTDEINSTIEKIKKEISSCQYRLGELKEEFDEINDLFEMSTKC